MAAHDRSPIQALRRSSRDEAPALKGLLRKGFPNDADELGNFARRYLFLGEARMLLGELRDRPAAAPST